MEKAPLPPDEDDRMEALERYQLLDTAAEKQFDDIVQLASQICQTPVSLISLIDNHRQWFKAQMGMPFSEISRDYALCAHTILSDELMVVEDASKDERFRNNPLVTGEPDIRFYAGAPLITHDKYRLGSLCVIDKRPRSLSDSQKFALKVLADQVVKLLELRYQNINLSRSLQTVSQQKKHIQSLLKERVKLTEELAKTNHTKDQMLSIIAHDLRGPLNTLQSLLTLMSGKEEPLQSKMKKYTTALGKSVENAASMLENLLEWGMIQLNGQEPEMKLLNIHSLVTKLQNVLEEDVHKKGNSINNLVPPAIQLKANATSLNLVLRNLLVNANKFTSQGEINVRAEEQENSICISIQDSGIGIEPEVMENLFNLGRKYSRPGTENEKGSGLGLHMSREIVRQIGGDLSINSKVGEGTTVSLVLPA